MAQIGLRYPVYAPLIEDDVAGTFQYGTGKVAAKAIRVDINLNIANGVLYADDAVAESVKEFTDGTITFTADDLEDDVKADWLDNEIVEETIDTQTVQVLKSNVDDSPGYFGFGFIIPKVKNKVRKYRAILYTKVQFGEPNETAESKGQQLNFQTPAIEGTIMRRCDGDWKEEVTVDTLALARKWLHTKLNIDAQGVQSMKTTSTGGDGQE